MSGEKVERGGLIGKINMPLYVIVGVVLHIISFYSVSRVVISPAGTILVPLFIFFPPILALSAILISIVQLVKGYRKVSAIIGLVLSLFWLIVTIFLLYLINLLLTAI